MCACVYAGTRHHLCIVMSRPACVCANASMHVCDWTPIARLRRLKPLLSPALILLTHRYHRLYLNNPTADASTGRLPSKVARQVSRWPVRKRIWTGTKSVLQASNGYFFSVLVSITDLPISAPILSSVQFSTSMEKAVPVVYNYKLRQAIKISIFWVGEDIFSPLFFFLPSDM